MILCGIDEAGRGPLAGPVVIAGVITRPGTRIEGIRDSKKLSSERREFLYDCILDNVLYYDIQIVDEKTVDNINILKSCMLGMENIMGKLKNNCERFVVDGNYLKFENDRHLAYNYETIVKGDDKVYEISCASILAKVTRDRLMIDYDLIYPEYGFKNNKGYGTPGHINSVIKHGPCEIHRKTFLRNITQNV
jgi:ribonuclease HII